MNGLQSLTSKNNHVNISVWQKGSITFFLLCFCSYPCLEKRDKQRDRLDIFSCDVWFICMMWRARRLLPQTQLLSLSPSRYSKVTTDMLKKKKPTRPTVLKSPRRGYTQIPTDMYTHIILQNMFGI